MGGGASSLQGVEDLITTTLMIGRAIAAISIPGMYRIYDFHYKNAPKLKNSGFTNRSFILFGYDDEDEDDDSEGQRHRNIDDETNNEPDPALYQHCFKVKVGDDIIYLDNPLAANDAGWTPLHTCCMSMTTVGAGLALIDYIVQRGGNIDAKTLIGPSSFNKGWTPLHMASAYGIEPLVEKLIEEGADVNSLNSLGYNPLLEACHRGFTGIVTHLLKNRSIDLNYIPPLELAATSPFLGSPPHSAIGEAARAGFYRIVQILIDAGADKDSKNSLGWTPLHEACFYNRIETVKTLLLAGANPCLRTKIGALPFHLAGFEFLRSMIADMGGPDAVPAEDDVVDMVTILNELTSTVDSEENPHQIRVDESREDSRQSPSSSNRIAAERPKHRSAKQTQIETPDRDEKEVKQSFLHSGEMLGNLPSLNTNKSPTGATRGRGFGDDLEAVLGESPSSRLAEPSLKADDKKPKKSKKNTKNVVPKDTPAGYVCQLTQKLMTEPVKSVYGHVFEKSAILNWFEQQGRMCPLTGEFLDVF